MRRKQSATEICGKGFITNAPRLQTGIVLFRNSLSCPTRQAMTTHLTTIIFAKGISSISHVHVTTVWQPRFPERHGTQRNLHESIYPQPHARLGSAVLPHHDFGLRASSPCVIPPIPASHRRDFMTTQQRSSIHGTKDDWTVNTQQTQQ